jgi:hypothetical protein
MYILRIALLGSAALFTSPALAFDGNAIQLASLTGDMVTATEGYPNPGENYVRIVPSAPPGNYFVAVNSRPECRDTPQPGETYSFRVKACEFCVDRLPASSLQSAWPPLRALPRRRHLRPLCPGSVCSQFFTGGQNGLAAGSADPWGDALVQWAPSVSKQGRAKQVQRDARNLGIGF